MKHFEAVYLIIIFLVMLILSGESIASDDFQKQSNANNRKIIMVVFTNPNKTMTVEIRADSTLMIAISDPINGAIKNVAQAKINNLSNEKLCSLAGVPRSNNRENSWKIAVIYENNNTAASESISLESEARFKKFLIYNIKQLKPEFKKIALEVRDIIE